jgi:hypothetical protein
MEIIVKLLMLYYVEFFQLLTVNGQHLPPLNFEKLLMVNV